MKNPSQNFTASYWDLIDRGTQYPSLSKDLSIDVAIIGGGIAGVSVAYHLIKEGLSVALFDDGLLGSGETGRTSAHLTVYQDGGLLHLKKMFGQKKLDLLIKSHVEAIDQIEQNALEHGIECEFRRVDGYLFSSHDKKYIEREYKTIQRISSLDASLCDSVPIANFNTALALKISSQAAFHPLKYILGLADVIARKGGQIFENTHIASFSTAADNPVLTTANGQKVMAKKIVVTTHSPVNNRVHLHTKLVQNRTYIIGIKVPKDTLADGLYWDTDNPYHYIRKLSTKDDDCDLIIVGGQDHRTGDIDKTKEAFKTLQGWVKRMFHQHEVKFEWSGQVVEPIDKIAYIGKNPFDNNTFVHTGPSGNGLTYGALAGTLIASIIAKKYSPYEKIYSPNRTPWRAFYTYLMQMFETLSQYRDWLNIKQVDRKKLPLNEGAICRKRLVPRALFKDNDGKIHEFSAVCPHLYGVVRYNPVEKCWDCPCHGSRFSKYGEVINGPANNNLTKIK